MSLEDFKNKDVVYELMQVNIMYNSIVTAYEEYQKKFEMLTPQQKIRSTMIVVTWPGSFQDYYGRLLKQEAENSHGDIVLMDGDIEIKRERGKLKSFKEKTIPYQKK